MRLRPFCVLVSLLACGGSESPAPGPGATQEGRPPDREPVITSVRISPRAPVTSSVLSVALEAYDPEGIRLQADYTWYRNGQVVQKGKSTTLPASLTARGNRIRVVATVSDRAHRVSREAAAARIGNEPPRVVSIRLEPESPTTDDALLATARAIDADRDPVELHYRWFLNGRRLRDQAGPTLPAGLARRGSEVRVSVAGHDGRARGEWRDSEPRRIANAAPRIASRPSYEVGAGNVYRYQPRVLDPDRDRPLRFQLDEGPEGMEIDLVTGLLSWKVPADASGTYPISLSVSDAHGGRTRQSYVLELHWEQVPAATP